MKYAPMRFDGVSLRHNPATLSISGQNLIREYASPCCDADSRNNGVQLRRVSGEGEFCGSDCVEQYRLLEQLQISGKRAKLVLPLMQPMYAFLKEVSLSAKPVDNVLFYRFVFIEAKSPRLSAGGTEYYLTRRAGESLWDISFDYSVPIETLTALNPQIPFIDDLKLGERVRIC